LLNVQTDPVAVFDNFWGTTLAFAKSLGEKGVPLNFYGNGAGRWSRYCTRHSSCPPIEASDKFEPWLRDKIRSGEITRVAPTTDLLAYYVSKLREEFAPEVRRTIAPLEEIERCLIKTQFASACKASGQPTLTTLAPDDPAEILDCVAFLGFPLMLKPKSHLVVGYEERGHLIEDVAELSRWYRRYAVVPGQEAMAMTYPELRWPLVQRYVPSARNRVYSVSGIKDVDRGILAATVSYKREQWPPDVGVSTVQIGCEDERVLKAGLDIVNQILSRGIFEIELLEEGEHLYAIDLNPRAFGFLALDIARGVDLPWLWLCSTMKSPSALPMLASSQLVEARHRLLSFRPLSLLRRLYDQSPSGGRSPIVDSENAGPRASVSMLGDWSDPLPMLLCHLHLLKHPRSLVRSPRAAKTGV
jgi:predicted ATP-grasp superfamily ATP-dependent carboligase